MVNGEEMQADNRLPLRGVELLCRDISIFGELLIGFRVRSSDVRECFGGLEK